MTLTKQDQDWDITTHTHKTLKKNTYKLTCRQHWKLKLGIQFRK